MKKITVLMILLSFVFVLYAFKSQHSVSNVSNDLGIKFSMVSFEEALKIANTEDKIIFLDVYATWCGPCKKLKSKTFPDEQVGSFYNANFINLEIDGETPEGKKLMEKYGLKNYPSLLFIDKNGNVLKKTVGFHNPTDFLNLGKQVVKKN